MLELPEALTLAKQLDSTIIGKTVARVLPPTKPHKFCWFRGDPALYGPALKNASPASAAGFGIFAEITFDNGLRLCVNDGVNMRFAEASAAPKDYQLLIEFTDDTALVFTVAMYGGIMLHEGAYDNEYYLKSKSAISPFSPEFAPYYRSLLEGGKPTLSAKALIATEQRIPGIGNGSAQDILFIAGLNPKRKLRTFEDADRERLQSSIVSTLGDMIKSGGRDTEKDLFGNPGGYKTLMSKNSLSTGCPVCGGAVVKEAYMGGSVYYCPKCQPLVK